MVVNGEKLYFQKTLANELNKSIKACTHRVRSPTSCPKTTVHESMDHSFKRWMESISTLHLVTPTR